MSVNSIVCPQCEASLEVTASVCSRCGAPTVDAPDEGATKKKKKRLLDRPWLIVVVLLHVGVLGIPMYWQTRYSLGVRLMIVAASVVYTIVAVGLIVSLGAYIWGAVRQLA